MKRNFEVEYKSIVYAMIQTIFKPFMWTVREDQ